MSNKPTRRYMEQEAWCRLMSDDNDCVVKALATVTGLHYVEANILAKHALGRVKRQGAIFPPSVAKQLLERVGYTLERDSYATAAANKTNVGQAMAELPKRGVYLVWQRAHIAAYRGGKLHDWSVARQRRHVRDVWRVVRDPERNAKDTPERAAAMQALCKLAKRMIDEVTPDKLESLVETISARWDRL